MNNFLTIKKILVDSVALYKSHFLLMTIMISAVLLPYSYMMKFDNLPDFFIVLIPVFIIAFLSVEIISTRLVATSYMEMEFNLKSEIIYSIKRSIPYLFVILVGGIISFIGYSMLVIPGVIISMIVNLVKVDFLTYNFSLISSLKNIFTLLKEGAFSKLFIIYILPTLLQFLFALFLNPYLAKGGLEESLYNIFPYLIGFLIVIFPVSICFRDSVYFNLLKYKHSNPTDQLV